MNVFNNFIEADKSNAPKAQKKEALDLIFRELIKIEESSLDKNKLADVYCWFAIRLDRNNLTFKRKTA